ncbi:hypothetical protein D3C85_1396110 [compost metagenome]
MLHGHSALELPRDDPQESYAVTVSRVHIRLNFEHIARKLLSRWLDYTRCACARLWWRCQLQEVFKERLHTEVVHGASEENRRKLTLHHFFHIKRIPSDIEQLDISAQLLVQEITCDLFN